MKELYTKAYGKNLLKIIEENLKDLELWSIHNQDACLTDIKNIQELFNITNNLLLRHLVEGGETEYDR